MNLVIQQFLASQLKRNPLQIQRKFFACILFLKIYQITNPFIHKFPQESNPKWMQTRQNLIKEIKKAVDPYKNEKIHLEIDFTISNYFKRSIADLLITILANFKSRLLFTWSSNNNEVNTKSIKNHR